MARVAPLAVQRLSSVQSLINLVRSQGPLASVKRVLVSLYYRQGTAITHFASLVALKDLSENRRLRPNVNRSRQ